MRLKDKLAFVTGGTRGIGKSITLRLLQDGACVVATYNKDSSAADDLKKYAETMNLADSLKILNMDVSKRDSVQKVMKSVNANYQRIDILVNNAGVNKPTDFDEIT